MLVRYLPKAWGRVKLKAFLMNNRIERKKGLLGTNALAYFDDDEQDFVASTVDGKRTEREPSYVKCQKKKEKMKFTEKS